MTKYNNYSTKYNCALVGASADDPHSFVPFVMTDFSPLVIARLSLLPNIS
jgi:hypothetical protein